MTVLVSCLSCCVSCYSSTRNGPVEELKEIKIEWIEYKSVLEQGHLLSFPLIAKPQF